MALPKRGVCDVVTRGLDRVCFVYEVDASDECGDFVNVTHDVDGH